MRYQMELTPAELPFRMRPARPLTNKEVERLSASQDALHIEREPNGDLMVRSVGGIRAGGVSVDVMMALFDWNDKAGTGKICSNTGCYLPDGSMRGAYFCWVSNEKWSSLCKGEDGFLPFCPELVVEVASSMKFPSLAKLQDRMRNWVANGAEQAWLFDPKRRVAEIYKQGNEPERYNEKLIGEDRFAGFELKLAELWNWPPRPPRK